MQNKRFLYFFVFVFFSNFLGASEENLLKGACGFNALNEDHIKGLDAWNLKQEVLIGAEVHHEGLIFQFDSEFTKHEFSKELANINFETTDDFSEPKELIAEREPLKLKQTKVEVNHAPYTKKQINKLIF